MSGAVGVLVERRDGRAGSVVTADEFGETEVAGMLAWWMQRDGRGLGKRVMNGWLEGFSLSR
jgi:hypothetical protein